MKTNGRSAPILLTLVFLPIAILNSRAQASVPSMVWSANQQTTDSASNRLILDGHAQATQAANRLSADRIVFDQNSRIMIADGHVSFDAIARPGAPSVSKQEGDHMVVDTSSEIWSRRK